ncbi:CsgG/HfaB family protein [Gillisia limnaea]|uniref:Curli production assembly/transport component CsgG n=1 Tax=Gillisia limnaea (strain DSM 15749 / LMG 21470 / R-8282) TaxID=865937 RepID=H2BS49_GILLR|nr:CsgG/HfaB family protein [Gillisia limnaea]EHQ03575.1 Curli production assembly/transport component CsgG [Gillisia limnaea DSM 15749]
MKLYLRLILLAQAFFVISCGTYFNQPVDFQEARLGESTISTKALKNLPLPQEPVVVGVYNFRDLTGQYKASDVGSTFSTAVTQGATSILLKALEDSRWFTPIERENIGNLLNERNIIRSTRQEYQGSEDKNQPQVPPLLYAGVILEGGIVSYDTNIITGGLGARYFGVGGSTQYRQDRVTIYLRAISTSSGKILKNIYTSKTVLSQSLDASLFKYVSFQRLMEAETGFTRNEPVQLAITEAIEKAVEGLIIEGIKDNLWQAQDSVAAETLVTGYDTEKDEAALSKLYGRKYINKENSSSLGVSLGTSLLSGDYGGQDLGGLIKLDFTKNIFPSLSVNIAASAFELSSGRSFREKFLSLDVNGQYIILPNDVFGPYLYGGPGIVQGLDSDDLPEGMSSTHFKLQYGIGAEYQLTNKIGIKAFAEHNIALDDELDRMINGKRDDHYFNFGVGINFYLGNSNQPQSN